MSRVDKSYLYGRSESTLGSDNPQIRKELSVPDPIRQLFPFIGKVIPRWSLGYPWLSLVIRWLSAGYLHAISPFSSHLLFTVHDLLLGYPWLSTGCLLIIHYASHFYLLLTAHCLFTVHANLLYLLFSPVIHCSWFAACLFCDCLVHWLSTVYCRLSHYLLCSLFATYSSCSSLVSGFAQYSLFILLCSLLIA